MIRFVRKSLAVLLSALIISGVLGGSVTLATKNIYKDNYQKGFVYQYRRLHQADKNKPKIIVFGGSYLSFSLNTKEMEELTGVPTYELGVQSNMGMCYNIELIEDYVNEGDVVVFPFEDFTKDDYGMDLIYITIESEPDMFFEFLKNHPKELLTAWPRCVYRRVAGLFRKTSDPYYTAEAFDRDYAYYNLDRPEPVMTPEELHDAGYAYVTQDIDPSCIERLNELNSLCEKKGAKLCITLAPMCKESVWTEKEGRDVYWDYLKDNLDAEVVCEMEDFFYDSSLAFNGNMQLNNAGMEKYTKDLADIILPFINR